MRILREFTHPDEDYPYRRIQSLAEVIAELAGAPARVRRVGIAGHGLMSFDFYTVLQQALPGVAWADLETALCNPRARKSPAKQAVIRHVAFCESAPAARRQGGLGQAAQVDHFKPLGVLRLADPQAVTTSQPALFAYFLPYKFGVDCPSGSWLP